MWCRSYRGHVIMAFPSFDTATSLWAPQANISWVVGTQRKSEFVRFAKRVFTEAEAAACALAAGQAWVDSCLKKSGIDAPCQISKDRTKRGHISRISKKTLTFDQFRSLMDHLDFGERQLQKSYAALLQLRKRQHCSWSDLISKMKNSQAQMAQSDLPRNTKSSHLPLTLRDWRRII